MASNRKYKSRKPVCTECRRQRRKCIQTLQSRCSRCERLDRKCVPSNEQSVHLRADSLEAQIEELEDTIHELETQMRNLSQHSNDEHTMICRSSNNSLMSLSTTSDLQRDMIQNLMFQWRVQIKNGIFQIETGIRSISDLLRFKPNISYLSPFSNDSNDSSNSSVSSGSTDSSYRGGESGMIMHFGAQSGSLVPFTIKLLTQCAKKHLEQPVTQQVTSSSLMHSGVVMDQLISIYFSCHNIYSPMVHQSTFMMKYLRLQDPMEDLLSVCICCCVCSSPCNHVFFTSMERRGMADFFYDKAKSIILDQFDLPGKRMENVMGINLLIKYMHTTMKVRDCRKLILMAYQICLDLKDDFEVKSSDSDQLLVGMELLDHVLYSRHLTQTLRIRRTMDFISSELVDDSCFRFPPLWYVDDEPEQAKRYLQAQNLLLGIYTHPFIMKFTRQIHRIHLGLVCELTFESIIRLEDVLTEWSASLPAEFHLCDDLKDMDLCKAAIDKTTDCVLLITFIHFHVFLISMYNCLLQPIALGADNDRLLSIVQQRALENSLEGCRLIIYAVNRIYRTAGTTSCHSTLGAAYFMFHAIDVLMSLSLSPNTHIAKEARTIMKTCLNEVDVIKFMQEHHVPTGASPILSGIMDFSDVSTFKLEYYDQYSQPWYAMAYDSSRYIASLK